MTTVTTTPTIQSRTGEQSYKTQVHFPDTWAARRRALDDLRRIADRPTTGTFHESAEDFLADLESRI